MCYIGQLHLHLGEVALYRECLLWPSTLLPWPPELCAQGVPLCRLPGPFAMARLTALDSLIGRGEPCSIGSEALPSAVAAGPLVCGQSPCVAAL